MPIYVVLQKPHFGPDGPIEVGGTVELPAEFAAKFPYRFEPVEKPGGEPKAQTSKPASDGKKKES